MPSGFRSTSESPRISYRSATCRCNVAPHARSGASCPLSGGCRGDLLDGLLLLLLGQTLWRSGPLLVVRPTLGTGGKPMALPMTKRRVAAEAPATAIQRSRWNRFAPWAAVALLFGCGGGIGADYALNFAGKWSGSLTTASGGRSTQRSTRFSIARTGPNGLLLEGVCSDGTGPTAVVTDAAHFAVASLGCSPVPVTGCAAVTLTITGGVGALAGDTLTLNLDATLVGCGQSYGVTYAFSGKHVDPNAPTTPTAKLSVQPSGAIALHTAIRLDASGSSDPGGSPLTYQWQLQPPGGSAATLSSPTGITSSFTPDVVGGYQITLVVSNGSASDSAHATVIAGVSRVLAVVPAGLYRSRGGGTALEASGRPSSHG